tara:strand:- start:2200 stop:2709 length:510 start_codon:yes stop_codon:yes gene_type:complete
LHLLRQPKEKVQEFSSALLNAHSQVGQCKRCFHLSSEKECDICKDPNRNSNLICIVSDSKDLIALERTREYRGSYHVLGGLISPMDGIGPEMLQISKLVERVDKENVKEIILALTPSVEGDTTSLYLARLLRSFCKVTRIAYGLPVGGELEFADNITLSRALEGRQEIS